MSALEFGICTDKGRWDAFVKASPQGTIFCQSAFLDALGDDYELLTVEESGRIALGAVVILRDGGVVTAPYPLTMYQGVLCGAEFQHMPYHRRSPWLLDRIAFLLSALDRRHARISLCLSHHFEDIRGFQWFNYHEPELGTFATTVRFTGLLLLGSLPDFDTYLTQVRAVRRQEYRKGKEQGLTIEASTDVGLLNRLHSVTFERQGLTRSPHEEALLVRVCAAALEHGFGELLICRDKTGEALSATLFLRDERYAYYYIGASDPQFRKTGAGTVLLMENIKLARERGLLGVDFVGVNSPNRGDFKTSFNARPTPYYILDYRRGPRAQSDQTGR